MITQYYSVKMLNNFDSKRSLPQEKTNKEPAASTKKERCVTGFDEAELPKRINSWMKNLTAGDCRNLSERKVRLFVY